MNKMTDSVDDEQDNLIRAEILVSGVVQEAGYRGTILPIARRHKLKGLVENLPDGTVRIIAEGPGETIERFIEEIDIRNGVIEVEKIDVDFSEPTGEFKWFGVKISDMGYELFQGFGTAKKYFDRIGDKVDCLTDKVVHSNRELKEEMRKGFESMGTKFDHGNKELKEEMRKGFESTGTKFDQGFDKMGDKIDHGFETTNENFQSLDGKYHTVSDELTRIRKAVEGGLTIKERKVEYSTEKENNPEGSRESD